MSAPGRRTRTVRAAQAVLLVCWMVSLARPTNGPGMILHLSSDIPVVLTLGDPLPWATLRTTMRIEDMDAVLPVRPNLGWFVRTPGDESKPGLMVWSWSAALPMLLLAMALPPLVADRRAGRPANWWWLVAVASAAGGFSVGIAKAVVFKEANRGVVGAIVANLHDISPAVYARRELLHLRVSKSDDWLPPAVPFGLLVGGLGTAGALRPWRGRTEPPA